MKEKIVVVRYRSGSNSRSRSGSYDNIVSVRESYKRRRREVGVGVMKIEKVSDVKS